MFTEPCVMGVLGPLSAFAAGFADELRLQGYTQRSARFQMQLMAHLSRWLVTQGFGAGDLSRSNIEQFLCVRRAAGYRQWLSIKAMEPILAYLRDLGVAPIPPPPTPSSPMEQVLERYRKYLTIERGIGHASARGYVDAVRPFLHSRVLSDLSLDLRHVAAGDVIAFITARCPHQGRSAAKLTVTALRSLLGFLQLDGAVERSLASAVPAVAGRQLVGLPKGLEPAQVQRLLASCDSGTRNGRRDLAILTMLVRLGMRRGEVAALRLEDIDWRVGEILVRGKGNSTERLPLPRDAGGALAEYLLHDRPASAKTRTVFLRIRAPHCALSPAGISQVVASAAKRAGLPQIFPHRLRHTAATQMLRAGSSLVEIGQLLRHRRALTTAIYAKVNREALRTIARTWPGDVA